MKWKRKLEAFVRAAIIRLRLCSALYSFEQICKTKSDNDNFFLAYIILVALTIFSTHVELSSIYSDQELLY